jgi:hypothetical protein
MLDLYYYLLTNYMSCNVSLSIFKSGHFEMAIDKNEALESN